MQKDSVQIDAPCPPFLRWAGSKRRLLPVLRSFWTASHKRYVEPFAGSACLFFALKPERALLGDLNPELIATYLQLRAAPHDVLRVLGAFPMQDKREYMRLRSLQPQLLSPSYRAARFIYLNRFCFNGIYRTNLKGDFNVPYGDSRGGAMPEENIFLKCSELLQSASFINADFEQVLMRAEPGDLVYMDPPYAIKARRTFREYDPSTFALHDIARLKTWMTTLDQAGISFLVSYAESDEADLLKEGFGFQTIPVRRNIAGFAAHRTTSKEILITNR